MVSGGGGSGPSMPGYGDAYASYDTVAGIGMAGKRGCIKPRRAASGLTGGPLAGAGLSARMCWSWLGSGACTAGGLGTPAGAGRGALMCWPWMGGTELADGNGRVLVDGLAAARPGSARNSLACGVAPLVGLLACAGSGIGACAWAFTSWLCTDGLASVAVAIVGATLDAGVRGEDGSCRAGLG